MSSRARLSLVLLLTAMPAAALAASAPPPETISPGGIDRPRRVDGPCPTFSWAPAAAAEAVELVVFELAEDVESGDLGTPRERPLLRARLPGRASSWTPALEECLEAGKSYAWVARSLADGAESPWSESRLFEVAADPARAELERAIESVIGRLLEEQRLAAAEAPGLRRALAEELAAGEARSGDPAAEPARPAPEPEITTSGVAALDSQRPDTTGIIFGVRGTTLSQTDSSAGLVGHAPAATGVLHGVVGVSDSESGRGVTGRATAASGESYGVWGETESGSGRGVHGRALKDSGVNFGVKGGSRSPAGFGGHFVNEAAGGTGLFAGASDGTGADLELASGAADPGVIAAKSGGLELQIAAGSTLTAEFGGATKLTVDDAGTVTAGKFVGDGSALTNVAISDLNCVGCVSGTEIADQAVGTDQLLDQGIFFADLNQNGCSNSQVMVWNNTLMTWACSPVVATGGNADTVGGVAANSFLRSDTTDSFTAGTLFINGGTTLDVNGTLRMDGAVTKATTSLVTNLNADLVDGRQATTLVPRSAADTSLNVGVVGTTNTVVLSTTITPAAAGGSLLVSASVTALSSFPSSSDLLQCEVRFDAATVAGSPATQHMNEFSGTVYLPATSVLATNGFVAGPSAAAHTVELVCRASTSGSLTGGSLWALWVPPAA